MLQNADLADQQAAMKRLTEKVKRLENQVEVIEEKCRTKVQENEAWRAKFFMEKDEAEKLAGVKFNKPHLLCLNL